MSQASTDQAVRTATIGAAVVVAHQIAGKAVRDALFLSTFPVTALPAMVVSAAVVSIVIVLGSSRLLAARAPARVVPLALLVSAALTLVEWVILARSPELAAVLVFLHVAALGSVLVSGFWTVVNERFDPRTAKRRIGSIAAGSTVGGLLGGLVAERLAAMAGVASLLPFLAALHAISAWLVSSLAPPLDETGPHGGDVLPDVDLLPTGAASGLQTVARHPYLRSLSALVVLGAVSAACLDYVFKSYADATFGKGEELLRFFAWFYSGAGFLTFVVQATLSRRSLEAVGLANTVATLPCAVAVASVGALFSPSLLVTAIARGAESVLRSSLFRSGYELLYTPIASAEKRRTKPLVDVGSERVGDAIGGAVVRVALLAGPAAASPVILSVSAALAIAALVVSFRLNRRYIAMLEQSLLDRAVVLDISDVGDSTTRSTLLKTMTGTFSPAQLGLSTISAGPGRALGASGGSRRKSVFEQSPRPSSGIQAPLDPVTQKILDLRSGDPRRVRAVLRAAEELDPLLAPHAIPLLAADDVAADAIHALRRAAPRIAGQLVDALLDAKQEFAVRRRLPRVLSGAITQHVIDGLISGLTDARFEVRFQCGRALAYMHEREASLQFDAGKVMQAVMREVDVGRPVWESHRQLDSAEEREGSVFVDEFLRDRTNRSLEHVFTMLSLNLPKEPLQVAYRGLHASDQQLRGTALEYLESVLPPAIKERLFPFLEPEQNAAPVRERTREEVLSDLLRSNKSVVLNLEEIRRQLEEQQRKNKP